MKLNFLPAPHDLKKPGDACFFESTLDSHHGNLWLYIFLPQSTRAEAFRIKEAKQFEPGRSDEPPVWAWDGDRAAPTLVQPIRTDNWNGWVSNGELVPM